MNVWQPIETAPTDIPVLVFDQPDGESGRQFVAQHMTAIEDGSTAWVYARRLGVEDPVAFIAKCPTHWMPLPEPPAC